MNKKIVVGLGEVLWDVYPDQALFGGAPANFACHAASLGAEPRIASAVGNDQLGNNALRWMEEHGLDRQWIEVDSIHPTGSVDISLDETGTPQYRFANDVAWDFLDLKPHWQELAQTCDAVCFGTLAQRSPSSSNAILQFLDQTKPSALRVFDVNLRQDFYSADVLRKSLDRTNVLKLNHEELPIVAKLLEIPDESELQTCKLIAERYTLLAVALTRGAGGSAVYLDKKWDEKPAAKIKPIDTVGAGDAFSAALIMGILRGKDPKEIHAHAADVAAYVCTQRGAVVPLPDGLKRIEN